MGDVDGCDSVVPSNMYMSNLSQRIFLPTMLLGRCPHLEWACQFHPFSLPKLGGFSIFPPYLHCLSLKGDSLTPCCAPPHHATLARWMTIHAHSNLLVSIVPSPFPRCCFSSLYLSLQELHLTIRARDGNGYPLPETRWVFALLGYGFGSISLPMGLLMGSNGNPTGTWAWVCSSTIHTRKPMGF
jgi:hypothetical protein